MTVRLSVAVMTTPSRLARARELAASLEHMAPEIVVDDGAGAGGNLHNARRAWSAAGAPATHHLVLQDDVILGDRFAASVMAAVAARPAAAISLFAEWGSRTANFVRLAAWQRQHWARVVDIYTPSQGLVLPAAAAAEFVAWSVGRSGADDHALTEYVRERAIPRVVTVPNLLDHADQPSLAGNGFHGVRSSAFYEPCGHTDFSGPVAGTGFTQVPWASWMRAMCEWFYCGDTGSIQWYGDPADGYLPAGVTRTALSEAFQADPAVPELAGRVNTLVLFEFWLTMFSLGLLAQGAEGDPAAVRAPFATALPGVLRRYLPAAVLDESRSAAADLAIRAFRRGAALAVPRPYPPALRA